MTVRGVTTCPHWDIHLMDGEPMFPDSELAYPLTAGQPGHEMVGEVIEIGPGVESPVVGDRVAAWRDRGTEVSQGCYGQYVAFDADCLLVVPRSLDVDAIAPLDVPGQPIEEHAFAEGFVEGGELEHLFPRLTCPE